VQEDASEKGVRLEEGGVEGKWRMYGAKSYSRCGEGRVTWRGQAEGQGDEDGGEWRV
jgi:hypothetical protein